MTRALAILLALTTAALAQEHRHPGETITGARAKFYETWMRPDMPTVSCCNKSDCDFATVVKRVGSQWKACRKVGDKEQCFIIPPEKVEENRDSPDGLGHLCTVGTTVICFHPGGGT